MLREGRGNITRLIAHSDLTLHPLFLPDRDRKLYRAVLETKGEFPDIMTVLSLSEWYPGHLIIRTRNMNYKALPEMSLLIFSSSSSSATSFINSRT